MKACLIVLLVGTLLLTGLYSLDNFNLRKIASRCCKDKSDTIGRLCFGWSQPESSQSDPCNRKPSVGKCTYAFASVTKVDRGTFLVQLVGRAGSGNTTGKAGDDDGLGIPEDDVVGKVESDPPAAWVGLIFYSSKKKWNTSMTIQTLQIRFGVACVSDVKPEVTWLFDGFGNNKTFGPNYLQAVSPSFEDNISEIKVQLQPNWIVCRFKLNVSGGFDEKRTADNKNDSHKVMLVGNSLQGNLPESKSGKPTVFPEYFTSSNYVLELFVISASANERVCKFVIQAALVLLLLTCSQVK